MKDDQVDTARFKEIKAGTLVVPSTPSALYTVTAPTTWTLLVWHLTAAERTKT